MPTIKTRVAQTKDRWELPTDATSATTIVAPKLSKLSVHGKWTKWSGPIHGSSRLQASDVITFLCFCLFLLWIFSELDLNQFQSCNFLFHRSILKIFVFLGKLTINPTPYLFTKLMSYSLHNSISSHPPKPMHVTHLAISTYPPSSFPTYHRPHSHYSFPYHTHSLNSSIISIFTTHSLFASPST